MRSTASTVVVALVITFFSCSTAWARPMERGGDLAAPLGKTFEVLSKPVRLGFGQVYNDYQKPISLPDEVLKDLAEADQVLTNFQADIVEFSEDGKVIGSVPLYDAYLHHYGALIGDRETLDMYYEMLHNQSLPMHGVQAAIRNLAATLASDDDKKPQTPNFFGGGSGAEERGTEHTTPRPYGTVMKKGTDSFMILMHLINTRGDVEPGTTYSRMAECPCSSDRDIDAEAGTIDGRSPNIPFGSCNAALLLENNTGCSLRSYVGGYRCCEHLWWVSEPQSRAGKPAALYGMRFTFQYEPAVPGVTVDLRAAACCDATASLEARGQFEYDVPQCIKRGDKEGDSECLHTLVGYQYLDIPRAIPLDPSTKDLTPEEKAAVASREVDLVYAVGHQHLGAAPLGIKLFKDATDELICASAPILGTGSEPGNEGGYLVGMTPCVWGTPGRAPPRMRRDTLMRIESTYNNTNPHYGVMSLWLMSVADVPLPPDDDASSSSTRPLRLPDDGGQTETYW